MDSKKLACMLVAVGLVTVGCDSTPEFTFPARDPVCADPGMIPCETTVEPTEDELTFPTPETFEDPVTNTYVVAAISLPKPMEGGARLAAPGFNVDGMDSGEGSDDLMANCEQFQPDYVSTTDPQHVGVDNALSGLIPTIEGLVGADNCPGGVTDGCVDALLQEQLEGGSLLLLMEVGGINDYNYDSEITLQLFLGALPAGAELMVDGSGQIAAGQTFDTDTVDLGPAVAGDIFNGRLRATADSLPLTIETTDFTIPLVITNAEVRFDISESALSNGAIGGVITVQSIIDAASMIMPGIEGTVRSVVEGVADVTPSAEDPMVCESVSVGIEFNAVTAIRNP